MNEIRKYDAALIHHQEIARETNRQPAPVGIADTVLALSQTALYATRGVVDSAMGLLSTVCNGYNIKDSYEVKK